MSHKETAAPEGIPGTAAKIESREAISTSHNTPTGAAQQVADVAEAVASAPENRRRS